MALSKTVSDPTGGTVSDAYHSIAEIHLNLADGVGRVVVHVHRSQAHKAAGAAPVRVRSFDLRPAAGELPAFAAVVAALGGGGRNYFYARLKELAEYQGAADV